MARRLALAITTLAAIALTACANPTSPNACTGGGGIGNGSGTCS